MNLNDVKSIIELIKSMLQDLIDANIITQSMAEKFAPIILESVLKGNYIEGNYT